MVPFQFVLLRYINSLGNKIQQKITVIRLHIFLCRFLYVVLLKKI